MMIIEDEEKKETKNSIWKLMMIMINAAYFGLLKHL